MTDKRVIVCNYAAPTHAVSNGSRCYVSVMPGDPYKVHLLARSRGGRWIHTWRATKRLRDFRFVTLPPEHPLYGDERIFEYFTDEQLAWLQRANEEMRGVN